MLTRPFYKKFISLFTKAKAEQPTKTVHNFPLSDPPEPVVRIMRRTRATRGAHRKRALPIGEPSSDPRFNHALRRFTKRNAIILFIGMVMAASCSVLLVARISSDAEARAQRAEVAAQCYRLGVNDATLTMTYENRVMDASEFEQMVYRYREHLTPDIFFMPQLKRYIQTTSEEF